MKSTEFITEGTEIFINGGTVIANRLSMKDGPVVQMFITKDEWEQVKNSPANNETHDYDVASAETIINDYVKRGAKVKWKSAADFNKDARDLENHRFAKDPEVKHGFDQAAGDARHNAKAVSKATLKTI